MSKTHLPCLRKHRPGPIRHATLAPELLELIKAVFDLIGPYFNMNLEQFEISFMRHKQPEREVAFWCKITKAWLAYHAEFMANQTLPYEQERRLIGALIAITTGVEDMAKLSMPAEVVRRLLQCCNQPGDPTVDEMLLP
jgi:hypothetical protein